MTDVLDKKIQSLPRGMSPVVLVFDDASPSQFRYIEQGGTLDDRSDERRGHPREVLRRASRLAAHARCSACCRRRRPDARSSATRASRGRRRSGASRRCSSSHKQGYELCNHTLYHARLDRPATRCRSTSRAATWRSTPRCPATRCARSRCRSACGRRIARSRRKGAWTDPKSEKTHRYKYDAVLEVSGNPNESVYDPTVRPSQREPADHVPERARGHAEQSRQGGTGRPVRVGRRPEHGGQAVSQERGGLDRVRPAVHPACSPGERSTLESR